MSESIEAYLSSIDWTEKIISQGVEQNSRKWLLNDLAEYLSEVYDIPGQAPNNLSSIKAKELMDGVEPSNPDLRDHPPVVAGKSERERKTVFKKAVADAQRKGYLENFRLQEPWHPKLFMEGEINTYPYQHNSMITFRGVSRDHFYLGGDIPDGKGRNATKRHSDSVLNVGHWNPGNSFNKDNEDAVWTTFKDTAEHYASRYTDGKRGVLLKIQVPTKWIQCGAHGVREVNNLQQIQSEFGSPEAYREHVQSYSDEKCAWLVRPNVPLHFIKKIWDLEVFNTSNPAYALPLQSKNSIDAIDLMHFFQKKKMPDKPNFGDAEGHRESWQIVAMKRVVSDTLELRDFCQQLTYDLQSIEGKEYNMKLVRKVVKEEEGINQLIADVVDAAQNLGVNVDLDQAEAESIEGIEKEIENIYSITEEINANTENDMANLISEGEVSSKFRQLINDLYTIQIGDPEKALNVEKLEAKNRALKEVSNNVVENFRKLKIGDERDRYAGYQNMPLYDFDAVTEQISEDVGGPSEGLNQAVEEVVEAANQLGIQIQIKEKEVNNLDSLQKALSKILKITKVLDKRIESSIEDIVAEGEIPASLIEPLESIYLIKISDGFEENVSDSKEKLSNEFGLLKREVKEGIQIVNWFYQLEVRFAEVVKMTEQAQSRGELKKQELYDIGSALFSYEKQHGKRYGTREIIERARRKLEIPKEVEKPEAENLEELEKAAKKRLKFIEQEKPNIKEVENRFKQMKQEIEEIREKYHDIPKDEMQEEFEELQKEFEHLMSEDGELYYFFGEIRNVSFEYQRYKSKIKQQSGF